MKYLLLVLSILAGLAQPGNAQEILLPLGCWRTTSLIEQIRPLSRAKLILSDESGCEEDPTGITRAIAFPDPRDLKDLPLVEIPATTSACGIFAVMLSGDGGWARIDRKLGKVFASHGVPIVGWNTLRYFWTPRTPDGASQALERILKHYLRSWNKQAVILAGYSFGADVLPFLVNRLPKDLTERIILIALLGPGKKAEFEFHLSNWIGWISSDALPVLPQVEKLKGMKILCFAGEEESESLCHDLEPSLAKIIILPGGHHFGGNYDAIAKEILEQAGKRTMKEK